MRDPFGTGEIARRLLAFLDVRGRPDRVKGLVESQTGIDVARKFVRLGDDRLEGCAHESVAVGLAPGERTGVPAQKWQVRREFLAKRHE